MARKSSYPSFRVHVTGKASINIKLLLLFFGSLSLTTVSLRGQVQQGSPIVANNTNPTGQSTSSVFVDTSKIVTTPNTVDQHIVSCLTVSTKCDSSQETAPATTITSTISITQSGISLILGSVIAPNGVQLLNISGNNNDVYCAFGWNFQSLTATPHPTLDASSYTGTGSSAVVAISITGNGNHLHNCYLQGSYLKDTGTSPPFNMGDCIDVGTSTVGLPTYGNSIEDNLLQFCGAVGINLFDVNQTTVKNNYVVQSYDAGIQATTANISTAAPSYKNEIANNWVQDTELKFNIYNVGYGTGNINVSSPGGPGSGVGVLRGLLVHDNYVFNTSTLCNSNFGNSTHVNPSSSDHGCSEGIQVTSNAWDVHVYNNYVYNTGSEGIVLCMNNCSATGNHVGNAGQNCPMPVGCGAILESVQNLATANYVSNTVVEGNTIWNDSTGGTSNNSNGLMGYCMWQNIGQAGTITNDNWIGNTCYGTANSSHLTPIIDGFKFTNSAAVASTIAGVNLVGNTIDAGSVTTPISENYASTSGRVFHGFNNIYGTGSALANLPTPGDLAFFDPASGTNGSYNVLDSGVAVTSVSSPTDSLTITPGTGGTTSINATGTDTNINLNLTSKGTGTVQLNNNLAVDTTGKVAEYRGINTSRGGVPSIVGTADKTTQAVAIPATTIYAIPASSSDQGLYRVCYEAVVTSAATTSSILGGLNGFQVTYADFDTSTTVTTPAGPTGNGNTIGTQISGCVIVNAVYNTNIQYSFGYTSMGASAMHYSLHVFVEAVY